MTKASFRAETQDTHVTLFVGGDWQLGDAPDAADLKPLRARCQRVHRTLSARAPGEELVGPEDGGARTLGGGEE